MLLRSPRFGGKEEICSQNIVAKCLPPKGSVFHKRASNEPTCVKIGQTVRCVRYRGRTIKESNVRVILYFMCVWNGTNRPLS
jgi:hypothetical protein